MVRFNQSCTLEEGFADEGQGELQDMVFAEKYFKQGDVVWAFVDVLKKNFFQNFIVVVFSNSNGNVVKEAKI